MESTAEFEELAKIVADGYTNAGWVGLAGAVLMVLLRGLRLIPVFESWWSRWPFWTKLVTPFLLAFAGFIVPALVGKMAVASAIVGAVTAGVAAVGLHHGTKFVGAKEFEDQPQAVPTELRRKLGLIVPIPKDVQERAKQ